MQGSRSCFCLAGTFQSISNNFIAKSETRWLCSALCFVFAMWILTKRQQM
jgi:hypothetical protein